MIGLGRFKCNGNMDGLQFEYGKVVHEIKQGFSPNSSPVKLEDFLRKIGLKPIADGCDLTRG